MAFSRSQTMSTTWADDVEEEEAEMQREESKQAVASPRAPYPGSPPSRSPRGAHPPPEARGPYGGGGGGGYGLPPVAGPQLPEHPPFKAYLGNIPYELTEDVVAHHFRGLDVRDVIITRHRDTGKPKGCFVEFGSQDDLAKALTLDGEPMLRRPLRVQVAEPPRRDGFAERRGGFGRRDDEGYGRRGGYGDRDRGGYGDRERGGYGFGGERERDHDWPSRRGPPAGDAPGSPRERPRLNLQPRSQAGEGGAAAAAAAPQPRSNPFGDAKPADTAAKLAELEQRQKARAAEEAAARKREKEAAAAAGEKEKEKEAVAASPRAAPPPPAGAAPSRGPPPPPAASRPVVLVPVPMAATQDGGAGRGRGGQARGGGPPAGRGAGRGEGGRGRGGRGRGGEGAGEPQAGRGRGEAGSEAHGGRGGRGGRGGEHGGRDRGRAEGGRGGGKASSDRPASKAEGKVSGAAAEHLRAKGYALTEDEAPKTKVDNPFEMLSLADE